MNKKSWLIFVSCLLAGLWLAEPAWAHQPRIVSANQLTLVENPGVSQAFYGELKGHEAYYLIDLKQAGDLYLQLLVPDLPGVAKDKSATVEYSPELGVKAESFVKLDAAAAEWQKYHEEFAGDNYFMGPEAKSPAEPGYYFIKIFSPENEGKYVLVIGQKEEFPAMETIKAVYTIPLLKKDFFQEPVTGWFNGKLGKYFLGGLLALLVLGFMFNRFNKVVK